VKGGRRDELGTLGLRFGHGNNLRLGGLGVKYFLAQSSPPGVSTPGYSNAAPGGGVRLAQGGNPGRQGSADSPPYPAFRFANAATIPTMDISPMDLPMESSRPKTR
jgi:hypothetical protein